MGHAIPGKKRQQRPDTINSSGSLPAFLRLALFLNTSCNNPLCVFTINLFKYNYVLSFLILFLVSIPNKNNSDLCCLCFTDLIHKG